MGSVVETLDELLGSLVELETADHAVRFAQGDVIVEWLGTHRPKRGEGKAFWGALASSIRHSSAYVHDLYRVSRVFPKEHRDPEHDWSWFRECAREADPIDAMARFDGMSVREIREARRGRIKHEVGRDGCSLCGGLPGGMHELDCPDNKPGVCPTCGRVMP